jgi:polyhydroxyalkanoate synthesis regulator phasin
MPDLDITAAVDAEIRRRFAEWEDQCRRSVRREQELDRTLDRIEALEARVRDLEADRDRRESYEQEQSERA